MLIVTGANGKLGRLVVEQLLERVPAAQLGVSVRDPEKARALRERGVRVRAGDYADPATLAHAFEGASRVLVVSSNTAGAQALAHHRAAIDAAKAAGARRIFYTSHVGASATSPFAPMRDHHATEGALRESGVPFTALRNGFYASSALQMFGGALAAGELAAPEDGPVSWTAHDDLARATAIVMSKDGPPESETLELTADAAFDLAQVAAMASEVAGRPVRRVVVADDAYRSAMVGRGVPEAQAQMLVGIFGASRRGDFARVSPTLAELIGRVPRAFREALKTHVGKSDEGPIPESPRAT